MRGSMTSWRSLPVIAVLVLTTACSVADYKKPISDFATATQDAETALVLLDKQVTDAYAALLRERAIAGEAFVKFESGNCQVSSARCQLVVGDELLSPKPALRQMIILMASVRTYADGLAAIVEADTAAKVASHVNATLGSVESLAETVADMKGTPEAERPKVSEFTTPAGKAINWVVGQYVAKVQVDGLKRATHDAQPVIADTADIFGAAAELGADVPKLAMADEVSRRLDGFRDARTENSLTALIESAAAYDRLLLASPPNIFQRLKEAHDALATQLAGGDVSLADAFAKIKVFAAEAEVLAKILKDLAAISDESDKT